MNKIFLFFILLFVSACTQVDSLNQKEIAAAIEAAKIEINDPKSIVPDWYRSRLVPGYFPVTIKYKKDWATTVVDETADPYVKPVPFYYISSISFLIYVLSIYMSSGITNNKSRACQSNDVLGQESSAVFFLSSVVALTNPFGLLCLGSLLGLTLFPIVYLIYGEDAHVPWHYALSAGNMILSSLCIFGFLLAFLCDFIVRIFEFLKGIFSIKHKDLIMMRKLESDVRKYCAVNDCDKKIRDKVDKTIASFKDLLEISYEFKNIGSGNKKLIEHLRYVVFYEFADFLKRRNRISKNYNNDNFIEKIELINNAVSSCHTKISGQVIKNTNDMPGFKVLDELLSNNGGLSYKLRSLEVQLAKANASCCDKLAKIKELLGYLHDRGQSHDSVSNLIDKITLDSIANKYIPDSISAYMAVPEYMRKTVNPNSGKSPDKELSEQLDVLYNQLVELRNILHSGDVVKLELHGRFLKEKFTRESYFDI